MIRAARLAPIALIAVAFYFVLVELHRPDTVSANDIYAYFVPNILHALNSLADGGKGLLWNPLQACGEPFFANTVNGLLYPPHLLFLVLDANTAVHVILIFNMAMGAIGMLLLARELGLGWLGAFAAALAFQLGDPMAQLTSWSPMHNGPWVWLPWTLLFVERLLREPTRRDVVALAVAIALEILPGFVLITAFTYQLIAFRVAWELLRHRTGAQWKSALAIGVGLALGPALVAIQLVPAAEYARESFRVLNTGRWVPTWAFLPLIGVQSALKRLAIRDLPIPFSFGLVVLAAIAASVARSRPLVLFYLLIGTLYGTLGFGDATPLYHAFIKLPPGAATLRVPYRFFWLTGLSLAVLTGFAIDKLNRADTTVRARWFAAIIAVAVCCGLGLFIPGGLRWQEQLTGILIVAAACGAALRPSLARPMTWVVLAAVGFNLFSLPLRWPGRLLASTDVLFTHAQPFAALRSVMTPQDRVLIVTDIANALNFSLMQKSASVLRVPTVHDYEALLGYRFSRYWMQAFQELMPRVPTRKNAPPVVRKHRLFDLAAARVVVASPQQAAVLDTVAGFRPAAVQGAGLKILSNDGAVARALYVPRIEVMADADAMLQRLSGGADDMRTVAFVDAPPASGFLGDPSVAASGDVAIVLNDPEHIEIDVRATGRGFLVLADTYFPGWEVTVNGASVPIERGNYMFRLVEVPGGPSRVVFRYRPYSVVQGACVSLVAVCLAVFLWRTRRFP